MRLPRALSLSVIVVAGAVALAAARPARPARPSPARVLVVTAHDFAFEAPDSVPAGLTEIREHNAGPSLHHVALYRLEAGKTLADFVGALRPDAPFPTWAKALGGPNTPVPGGWSNATVVLTPGRYAMLCFIGDSANRPHFMLGMEKELVVTGATKAVLPAADRTVDLSDYTFGIPATLPAGKQMWKFVNTAGQEHEALLVMLAPGTTQAAFAEWVGGGMKGPPPAMPVGGISGLAPGGASEVAFDLTPGSYVLICFIPDAKDGKDHWTHGMMKGFEVR